MTQNDDRFTYPEGATRPHSRPSSLTSSARSEESFGPRDTVSSPRNLLPRLESTAPRPTKPRRMQ
jgi:hypothetical protein